MKHEAARPDEIVSRETIARLKEYERLLRRWNQVVNLVGAADLGQIWERHIADCLQLLPLLPSNGPYLDIGSGAGFPGLVLAIASGKPFHLVESDRRKAAFLREAGRLCGANVIVLASRIESVEPPKARLITARAVAPLPKLLELAFPHLHPLGSCLFQKGAKLEAELTAANAEWNMTVARLPSLTDSDSVILQISGLTPNAQT